MSRRPQEPGTGLGEGRHFVRDARSAGESRCAVVVAALFPLLLLAVDAAAGSTSGRRTLLWAALGLVLLAVLWPTRVRATTGLLTTRGLLRGRHVRTDRLASVAWHDGIAQRLVLEDTEGNRLELDPRVLAADPALRHVLDQDIRTSLRHGTVRHGAPLLQRLALLLDTETARTVFRVSHLP
ncbi:hypothetical protein [Streptomyces sp. NPDC051567]|uniref:hypothetical protein n=1 Tax=Streptomyces sp. NPDC051567 TaxID=3365660 RepID=UPI0037A9F74A